MVASLCGCHSINQYNAFFTGIYNVTVEQSHRALARFRQPGRSKVSIIYFVILLSWINMGSYAMKLACCERDENLMGTSAFDHFSFCWAKSLAVAYVNHPSPPPPASS